MFVLNQGGLPALIKFAGDCARIADAPRPTARAVNRMLARHLDNGAYRFRFEVTTACTLDLLMLVETLLRVLGPDRSHGFALRIHVPQLPLALSRIRSIEIALAPVEMPGNKREQLAALRELGYQIYSLAKTIDGFGHAQVSQMYAHLFCDRDDPTEHFCRDRDAVEALVRGDMGGVMRTPMVLLGLVQALNPRLSDLIDAAIAATEMTDSGSATGRIGAQLLRKLRSAVTPRPASRERAPEALGFA